MEDVSDCALPIACLELTVACSMACAAAASSAIGIPPTKPFIVMNVSDWKITEEDTKGSCWIVKRVTVSEMLQGARKRMAELVQKSPSMSQQPTLFGRRRSLEL